MVSLIFIVHAKIHPYLWHELVITFNLFLSIPFIITAILSLRNLASADVKKIQKILIVLFVVLGVPSLWLPLTFEIGGLITCLAFLACGIFGIFFLQRPYPKLVFINVLGILVLALNVLMVFGL
jgi:hypothetical protein